MKSIISTTAKMIVFPFLSVSVSNGQTLFIPSSDTIQIAYEVHGKGKVSLVFVHGWSCDRTYWKAQVESFSEEFKVITLDLAGHGESGIERRSWTIEAFGSDVVAVITKLGLDRVILIGHSMGGDVIAEAARQLKGKVAGLIMVDAYKKLGQGRTPAEVQAFIAKLIPDFRDSTRSFVKGMFRPDSDSSLVNWVADDMSSEPPVIALDVLQHRLSYSRQMPHTLEELNLPVIAINPDNAPTDIESMNHFGVDVTIMHGVGHFMMMEDPERFNRLLRTAINKLLQ